MDLKEIREKTAKVLAGLKKPDYKQLETFKFNDLFYANEKFYQICFYDRTEEYCAGKTYLCFKDKAVADNLVAEMNRTNSIIEELLEKADLEKHYHIGSDIGFCFVSVYERHKQTEENEETNMSPSSDEGPFGGAFRDMTDYYNYREK